MGDTSTVICWTNPFINLGVSGLFCYFYSMFDRIRLANNVDSDLTPRYVASDLGLHCLPMILYGFPGKNRFISTSRPYSS